MPKPLKDINHIPMQVCPLCASSSLSIIQGKKTLFLKSPDSINCGSCNGEFKYSRDSLAIQFTKIASPYAFFENQYGDWIEIEHAIGLSKLIRTNDIGALDYLSGASKYLWHLRLLLGATGRADASGVDLTASLEHSDDVKDANRVLSEIRQTQKEIRQLMRRMALDMKDIRARYGRKKENQAAKIAALYPYENAELGMQEAIVQLDRARLDIQQCIEDQRSSK